MNVAVQSLDMVRRDLEDTKEALATYWSRSLADMDYKVADIHMAAEALMRAVSSLTLAVERLSEPKRRRVPCTDWSCKAPHEVLRTGPTLASFHPEP